MRKSKRFVLYSLFTIFFVVTTIILTLEVFTRNVLIPNDIIAQKEIMIENKKKDLEVIGLGDSHVMNGLDINSNKYFNFGISGEPIPIWYFKFKWLVENVENMDTLFLQMDYHIFSSYRTNNIKHITIKYKDYIDEKVNPELGYYPNVDNKFNIPLYSLQVNYKPIVIRTFIDYLSGDINKPVINKNGTLYSKEKFIDKTAEERENIAKERVNQHVYNEFLVNEHMVDYYEKIIKLAQDNNVRVVLIRYPLSNKYLELIDKNVDERVNNIIEKLKKNHNLEVFDYRRVFAENQELFSDEDHLNEKGAKEFGNLVITELYNN